jgi:hypothetical protein
MCRDDAALWCGRSCLCRCLAQPPCLAHVISTVSH